MSMWVWIPVLAAIMAALLAIGITFGWVHRDSRGPSSAGRRLDALTGLILLVFALAMAADVINLQLTFRRHVTEHVKCMEDATGHLTTIALARRGVDEAAARYDQQFILWLSDNDGAEAANRESFIASIRDVAQARADMVKTYDANPPIEC